MEQLVVHYSRMNVSAPRGETQSWSTKGSAETNSGNAMVIKLRLHEMSAVTIAILVSGLGAWLL